MSNVGMEYGPVAQRTIGLIMQVNPDLARGWRAGSASL